MNPTALLTGSSTKPSTGGSLQGGAVDQPGTMAFAKHLNAKNFNGDNTPNPIIARPNIGTNFSGVLNSVAELIKAGASEVTTRVEGGINPMDVDGVAVDLSDPVLSAEVQTGVLEASGADDPSVVLSVAPNVATHVAMSGKPAPAGVGDAATLVEGMGFSREIRGVAVRQDAVAVLSGLDGSVAQKAANVNAMQQFLIPEVRRVQTSEGDKNNIQLSMSGTVKPEGAAETLKAVVGSQGAGLQKQFLSEGERPPSMARIGEGVIPSFQNGVSSVMTEIVTERQVSSTTSVQERAVVEQLANGALKVVAKGAGKVVVKLTPEHLGNVEVTLGKKNGLTTVRVVVDRAETMELVRADLRTLERSLIEAGVDVRSNSINLALRSSNNEEKGEGGLNGEASAQGKNENNNKDRVERSTRLHDNHDGLLNIRV